MDLISFGTVYLEIVFGHLDRLPQPGEEIFSDSFAFSLGGAVTTPVAAARAGATAGLATLLGDDLGSSLVVEYCCREGVDLSQSEQVAGPVTGITVVLNFGGDRAFLSHHPPRSPGLVPDARRWPDILRRARPAWCYLHAGLHARKVLEQAHALGTKVALDVNLEEADRFPDEVARCARLADLFLPNEEELLRLTRLPDLGRAMDLVGSWSPLVVVKRGVAGAIAVEQGKATDVAEGVEDVVVEDRTGAGDAFAGAMIAALVRGAGLLDAVAAGNAAGSAAVARLGAAGELPIPGLAVAGTKEPR
jgi:sugar/nucleoside kinase (ribokinase family)